MEPELDRNVEGLSRQLVDGIAPEALPLTGARAGLMVAAWFKLLLRRWRG